MKKLLLVVGSLLVLVLLVAAAALTWLLRSRGDFASEIERGTRAGHEGAIGIEQRECVAETMKQGDGCIGLRCQLFMRAFLESCLRHARCSEDVCDDVPSENEVVQNIRWRLGICEALDERVELGACSNVLNGLQSFCQTKREKRAGNERTARPPAAPR